MKKKKYHRKCQKKKKRYRPPKKVEVLREACPDKYTVFPLYLTTRSDYSAKKNVAIYKTARNAEISLRYVVIVFFFMCQPPATRRLDIAHTPFLVNESIAHLFLAVFHEH